MSRIKEKIEKAMIKGHGNKSVDPALVASMSEAIMSVLKEQLPETVILGYVNFQKEKHTVEELINELIKKKETKRHV